jgi:hypothetical protein
VRRQRRELLLTHRRLRSSLAASALASALLGCGSCGDGAARRRDDAAVRDAPPATDAPPSTSDGGPDAPPGARPHPLYPALDLDDLPAPGGAPETPYRAPALPATTRAVTVSATGGDAARELLALCTVPGSAVTVPDAAGNLGTVFLGDVTDCDITLGPAVVVDILYLGHLNVPPSTAPVHRVRVRGGQLGQVLVDPGSTDLVLDGVAINNAVVAPALRAATGIFLIGDRTGAGPVVERFAVVNSIIRMTPVATGAPGATDGAAYLAQGARDVLFASDNVVTAGNRNAWGFLVGGGRNQLFVDLAVRVSMDKLVRVEDAAVDYLWVRGGTWMRQATTAPGGGVPSDAFVQRDDRGADHVYLHDATVYLLPEATPSFGASPGPGQNGKRWEARRLAWHARSAATISDAVLTAMEGACAPAAICDYGAGTHSYHHDPALALPASPWRDLPAFADDDPDHQPTAP